MLILALLAVAGFAFYVMNEEERARALRPLGVLLRRLHQGALLAAEGLRRFVVAVLARDRRALAGLGAIAVIMIGAGLHSAYVRSFMDVRPEIERLIAAEEATAHLYESAVAQFKLGAVSADSLAALIKQKVIPELAAVRQRLKALDRVPPEHLQLLAHADEYLHLRHESWRLRADALEKRSMSALRKAEQAERVSLEAFQRVRLPDAPPSP